MKSLKYFPIFVLILMLCSCQERTTEQIENYNFDITHQQKRFAISSAQQLEQFVINIIPEKEVELIMVQQGQMKDMDNEMFLAIKAQYTSSKGKSTLIIPLSKKKSIIHNETPHYLVDCTMYCHAPYSCKNGCEQIAYKSCEQMTCSCTGQNEGEGCSTEMGMFDNK